MTRRNKPAKFRTPPAQPAAEGSPRRRLWLVAAILVGAIAALGWVGLRPARRTVVTAHAAKTYVATAECASCHAAIAASYSRTGMGRAFYGAAHDPATADPQLHARYFHAASKTWFALEHVDGRLVQRRWQVGADGKPVNLDTETIDAVMGSGNHVRSYLHRNAMGTLTELPLAWYAEGGGSWGMNPGFDNAAPATRRLVAYECMFCHNGYPQTPVRLGDPVAYPVYAGALPEGIDCQRCHGPGSAHVAAAQTPGVDLAEVRAAILNPARLSDERQMEVCLQCHLETTSARLPGMLHRYGPAGTTPFHYSPEQPLGEELHHFTRELNGAADPAFQIVSAPYRLRQSQCFLKSGGALTCERCHDPHEPHQTEVAEKRYVSTCLGCHAARMAQLVAAAKHTEKTDCIGCHMPKRRTDDVVHAVLTDHLIQRFAPPAAVLLAAKREVLETPASSYRGLVVPYRFGVSIGEEDELYVAAAQVIHDANSAAGIPRLKALLAARLPDSPDFSIELGDAMRRAGSIDEAIAAYRQALGIDPHSLRARRTLGIALLAKGDVAEAVGEFQAGLREYPEDPLLWYQAGLAYAQQRQLGVAIEDFRKAIQLDPALAEGWENLGIALALSGDRVGAEKALAEALRIAPYDTDIARNVAVLRGSAER